MPRRLVGGTMQLAFGAPTLALATGAALLPVTTLRRGSSAFDVVVEPALTPPSCQDRKQGVADFIDQFMERIEATTLRHPTSMGLWSHMSPWEGVGRAAPA